MAARIRTLKSRKAKRASALAGLLRGAGGARRSAALRRCVAIRGRALDEPLARLGAVTLVLFLVAVFPIAGALTEETVSCAVYDVYASKRFALAAGVFSPGTNLQSAGTLAERDSDVGTSGACWLASVAALDAGSTDGTACARVACAGEGEVRTEGFAVSNRLLTEGLLLLAITYLSARTSGEDSPARRALAWIGGLAVLPLGVWAFLEGRETYGWGWRNSPDVPPLLLFTGWAIAICAPLALAFALRKSAAWTTQSWVVWVLVIGNSSSYA